VTAVLWFLAGLVVGVNGAMVYAWLSLRHENREKVSVTFEPMDGRPLNPFYSIYDAVPPAEPLASRRADQ
jgi:hypothetical protein